ncbi:YciI family protein [Actinoplanes sp. NPDC049681]|uniref:YciI family protein n=1 Tax=Actinoplanes sp. NPDC049681 TaxID=3363905 RepID=UPI0037BA00AE
MARYLILIYGDEQAWDAVPPQELEARHAAHVAFAASAGPAILGGAQLQPAATATSLRAGADGRPAVTDGPFLETKEVLGGYYVVDAPDLDAAIAMASRLREATAGRGGIEIRPLVEPN